MAKVRRVFEVAKELGVASKAIVEKCKAEEVPGITNHMSTVKVGLEATIKQWFSASTLDQATAVEKAEKVDLGKARKARRRRKGETGLPEEDAGVATATIEAPPPAEPPTETVQAKTAEQAPATKAKAKATAKAVAPPIAEPVEPPEEAEPVQVEAESTEPTTVPEVPDLAVAVAEAAMAEAEPAVAEPPDQTEPTPDDEPKVDPPTAAGRPNVPDRPKLVKPAGDKLEKPKEAQLKGPRVVRIEQPDVVRAPRAGRPPSAPKPGDTSGDGVSDIARSRGPVRGRGVSDEKENQQARSKRRTLSSRRGRSADALPTGPSKFSQADIEELDARLKGATGYLKQRRRDLKKREQAPHLAHSAAVTGGKVQVSEPITIKGLSAATGLKSSDIIKYLFQKDIMATINSAIDTDTAMEVCLDYNIELEVQEQQTAEQRVIEEFESRDAINTSSRLPVVTVLGHVDHGKTSLLDKIRASDVAENEDGGITQHIGAYRVTITGTDEKTKSVVFLDTPGHEAFTSMRARGAGMTDLVVLVVAADDGVMPQTIESINHARAAGVPIIVALNKIDVPQATETNIRKIYGQLSEHGLNPVEWGGQTEVIKVSATEGTGITELLEVLDYQAELLELTADSGGPARGVVIETEMKEGRGPVARVLVQQGRLAVGEFIVAGRAFGRVRDMSDDRGKPLTEAGPSTPLEFSGIDLVPDAGDKFYVTNTLQKAEGIALQYRESERQVQLATQTKVSLENFAEQIKAGQTKDLRVVLKADAQGSIDVLRKSLEQLAHDEVVVRTLHAAVGGITESDVLLANASDAVVVGFHVIAPPTVRDIAEQRHVEIRTYRVIYELIDDIKKGMEGLLEPEKREDSVGEAEVRQVFRVSKMGMIAGCLVTQGAIQRGTLARVIRDGVIVTEDRPVESVRRVKEDVREVRAGTECGIRIAGFDDVKPADRIICYRTVEVKRTLG